MESRREENSRKRDTKGVAEIENTFSSIQSAAFARMIDRCSRLCARERTSIFNASRSSFTNATEKSGKDELYVKIIPFQLRPIRGTVTRQPRDFVTIAKSPTIACSFSLAYLSRDCVQSSLQLTFVLKERGNVPSRQVHPWKMLFCIFPPGKKFLSTSEKNEFLHSDLHE